MNETELERFRQELLALRAELEARETSSRDGAKPADPDHAGMSRLDAMQAHKKAEEASRGYKRQLQKIDGALRRIRMGEFGRCFVCEKEIEEHRLAADPTITRCMNCVEQPSE